MSYTTWIDYLKQLNHPDTEVKRRAILQLGESNDPHVLKVLSQQFADGHPAIRLALFQVFTAKKNRQTAEIVTDVLHSSQISVKSLAMEILKELGEEAIFPLKRLTKMNNPELRKIAAELLGDINHPMAANILLDLLNDSDETVLLATIESLGKHREIRTVPRLVEMYEKLEKHRPVILNALGKIFLHWEKFIIQNELLETDPMLTISLVNSIQENGSISTLNLIMHWLCDEKSGITDEVFKALASILEKNPFVLLPHYLLPYVNNVWKHHSDEIPLSAYLKCISHIPSTEVLNILIEFFEKDQTNRLVEEALIQFILRFQPIFFQRYFQLSKKTRKTILSRLIHHRIQIQDIQLLQVYLKVKDDKEKSDLLRLAVISKSPEAKHILLARLSDKVNSHTYETLYLLNHYTDENLWPLFQRYLHHPDRRIRECAMKGVLKFPERTCSFLLEKINQYQNSEEKQLKCLELAVKLPSSLLDHFFQKWFKPPLEPKIDLLKKYISQNKETHSFPIIAKSLASYPEAIKQLIESLLSKGISIHFKNDYKLYLSSLKKEDQKKVLPLFEKLFNKKLDLAKDKMSSGVNFPQPDQ